MRFRFPLLALSSLVLFAAPAAAQKLKAPLSPPPAFVVGHVDKAGKLTYQRNVSRMVPVQKERTVIRDGKLQREKFTVYKALVTTVVSSALLKDIDIYKASGEKVDAEDAKDELGKPQIMLLSGNGVRVDPFYLKVIKPETIVIVDKSRKPRGRKPGVRK